MKRWTPPPTSLVPHLGSVYVGDWSEVHIEIKYVCRSCEARGLARATFWTRERYHDEDAIHFVEYIGMCAGAHHQHFYPDCPDRSADLMIPLGSTGPRGARLGEAPRQ